MENFFKDNEDIKFLFEHLDLEELIKVREDDFCEKDEFSHAPSNTEDHGRPLSCCNACRPRRCCRRCQGLQLCGGSGDRERDTSGTSNTRFPTKKINLIGHCRTRMRKHKVIVYDFSYQSTRYFSLYRYKIVTTFYVTMAVGSLSGSGSNSPIGRFSFVYLALPILV